MCSVTDGHCVCDSDGLSGCCQKRGPALTSLTHGHKRTIETERGEREKGDGGSARMKEKKNHFLTSVYSHSVPELQSSNQPWRKAAPDPGRNLKALEVRGH